MRMRKSKVLEKLRQGRIATSIKLNLSDPRVAEIAAMCGYDCVWLDMEHVPTDWLSLENLIRAAKIYDVDTMVRIARGSYSDYIRPLEADAAGIMVPHLMSLEEAKRIVYYTRFHPVGRRPLDSGCSDGAYCMVELNEYLKTANKQRFVVVQIEDPEPMDELDEIAALEGIDMLFFGPADFSQGIGTPGQWDNPEIANAQRRVAEAASKNNKFAGTVADPDGIIALIEMGYTFFNVGADVTSLGEHFRGLLEQTKKSIGL